MVRPSLDLNVLRTFVAGVEHGSFAQASVRIGRSQSAVSAQLQKLEEQVGRPLLRKQGRGLTLTDAGETMLSYARRLLELNDEALHAVQGTELEGPVRLGLPQDFAEHWLPEVLGRFTRQHARVRIEVQVDRGAELLNSVEAGRLDMALTWGVPDGVHAEQLAELPICWIGPAKGELTIHASEPLPVIAFEPPCRFRAAGISALDAAGLAWRLSFSSPSLTGLWAAVTAGLGVTMRTRVGLPAGVRVLEAAEGGLPRLPRIVLSLHASEAAPTPAAASLINILRDKLRESLAPFMIDEMRAASAAP